MKFTFLTTDFYKDYPHEKYSQMEIKETRPYAHIYIELYNHIFAIPLRSNIDHPHAYFTNRKDRCGVDYSKVIVVKDTKYIDSATKVFLRPDEYKKLQGKDYKIKKQLEEYIKLYKRAKNDETVPHREEILKFSTLQYFEEYIE